MTLCIAVIGTSDQSCWLAEACKILVLLLLSLYKIVKFFFFFLLIASAQRITRHLNCIA